MSKRISILHFLSNYIIVLLPIFTLCVMGPTEIYFGNYKELGFTYQEFGWKFLFFSFLITTLLTLILSFLPDKIQKYFDEDVKLMFDLFPRLKERINQRGGTLSGGEQQMLAIARALVKLNPEDKSALRAEGFMTRDPRVVERKKPGRPGARKRFQFSKR